MSFLDDLGAGDVIKAGSSLLGGILGYKGTQDTNQQNQQIAQANNAWNAQQFATRYQVMTKDLEAAGLNPMLAYSQSPGSAPTAQQVTFQNPMSASTQGFGSVASGLADVASASRANAQIEQIKHQNEQIDATVAQIKEQTKKIPKEVDQINYAIQKLAEEAANIAQDTENKTVARKQIVSLINKTNSETGLLRNQLQVEKSLDNLGRTSKELAPAAKILLDLFRSVK